MSAQRQPRLTIRSLRAEARKVGVEIEDDRQEPAISLLAPPGQRFEPGLHELVTSYEYGYDWREQAIAAALADLRLYPLEVCDDPACEWCRP